jgi:hypothetical protein
VVKKKNPRTLPGAARSGVELGASISAVGDLRGFAFVCSPGRTCFAGLSSDTVEIGFNANDRIAVELPIVAKLRGPRRSRATPKVARH